MSDISVEKTGNERNTDPHLAAVLSSFVPYIERRISGLSLPGLEKDDLLQEAFMALFSAIETYDSGKGASFSTYAIACINNRLADSVRTVSNMGNRPLNESLPLPETDDGPEFVSDESPEEAAILKEEYSRVRERMTDILTELEREALLLYSVGYSYAEIAERMNTTSKSVGNAIQRARRKLKE